MMAYFQENFKVFVEMDPGQIFVVVVAGAMIYGLYRLLRSYL